MSMVSSIAAPVSIAAPASTSPPALFLAFSSARLLFLSAFSLSSRMLRIRLLFSRILCPYLNKSQQIAQDQRSFALAHLPIEYKRYWDAKNFEQTEKGTSPVGSERGVH